MVPLAELAMARKVRPARVMTQFTCSRYIHRADQIHIAQPTLADHFEDPHDAGVVTPHVADLQDALFCGGYALQLLKLLQSRSRRLLNVDVLSRFQRGECVFGQVPDFALDGHGLNAAILQDSLPR